MVYTAGEMERIRRETDIPQYPELVDEFSGAGRILLVRGERPCHITTGVKS
jgi:hypothetical protein